MRQLAAARGEKSKRRNEEGQMLELLMGNRVDRATIQHGIASWTQERILRWLGSVRSLLMSFFYQIQPEMSRAERAGRAKKMNKSHCPALRRCRRGEAAPSGRCEAAQWLHWKGKVWSIARFRLYPASSSGRCPAGLGNPSCYWITSGTKNAQPLQWLLMHWVID